MEQVLINKAWVEAGIFGVLFVLLFIYTIRDGRRREDKMSDEHKRREEVLMAHNERITSAFADLEEKVTNQIEKGIGEIKEVIKSK